jgi:hypothetical protein
VHTPVPGAAPSHQLTADAIAKAVATAREAAARTASYQAGSAPAQPDACIARHTDAVGQAPWHAGAQGACHRDTSAAKMSAEDARRVAQQAAQRVAHLARGPADPNEWAWSKK